MAVNERALAVDITLDLDIEIQNSTASGPVLEERQIGDAILSSANTNNNRSPVAAGVMVLGAVPDAGLLGGQALVVEVVLGRGGLVLPLVVGALVRVGQSDAAARLRREGDDHCLAARVLCAAGRDDFRKIVLNGNATDARSTKSFTVVVGKLKLAILVAPKSTNRLASRALSLRPLHLLVARLTSIRAESLGLAAASTNPANNVADGIGETGNEARYMLEAGPSLLAQPVDGKSAILRGELGAINLSARELGVDTGDAARAGAGLAARSSLSLGDLRLLAGRRRGRGCRSRLWRRRRGRRALGLDKLSAEVLAGRGLGGRGRRRVGRRRLANDDKVAVLQAVLGLASGEDVVSEDIDGLGGANDNLGHDIGGALLNLGALLGVQVLVAVVVRRGGSSSHGGHESVGDALHCRDCFG